jgi:hypothetical protein
MRKYLLAVVILFATFVEARRKFPVFEINLDLPAK